MVGPNVAEAPYLTMAEPPGLMSQLGALYYIDTSTAAKQPLDCVKARTADMFPAPFVANESYVLYNLFAKNDARLSYQLFVGDGVNNLEALQGRYVRVTPHLHASVGDSFDDFRVVVDDACVPGSASGWCAGLPAPTVSDGILTVVLDQSGIAEDFEVSARADYERCMPRDFCYFDGTRCQPCANDRGQCIRQGDFLPVDLQSMNHVDATGNKPLDIICQDWAIFASGTTSDMPGELSLVDCRQGGCLAFAFTLPDGFVGDKTYQEVGAGLGHCFLESAWIDDALIARGDGLSDPPMRRAAAEHAFRLLHEPLTYP